MIDFAGAENTSAAKGETLSDTVRMVSAYADLIVMRHYIAGAPRSAKISEGSCNKCRRRRKSASYADSDGYSNHKQRDGKARQSQDCCGWRSQGSGRTAHSLVKAMARYPGNKFISYRQKNSKCRIM